MAHGVLLDKSTDILGSLFLHVLNEQDFDTLNFFLFLFLFRGRYCSVHVGASLFRLWNRCKGFLSSGLVCRIDFCID